MGKITFKFRTLKMQQVVYPIFQIDEIRQSYKPFNLYIFYGINSDQNISVIMNCIKMFDQPVNLKFRPK